MLDRIWHWLTDNVWMIVAIGGGILVSMLTSEDHNLKSGTARVLAGLFFAVVFPDPILAALDRDPEVYGNALSGLLAMTGYAIAKTLVSTGPMDWLAAWRGKK